MKKNESSSFPTVVRGYKDALAHMQTYPGIHFVTPIPEEKKSLIVMSDEDGIFVLGPKADLVNLDTMQNLIAEGPFLPGCTMPKDRVTVQYALEVAHLRRIVNNLNANFVPMWSTGAISGLMFAVVVFNVQTHTTVSVMAGLVGAASALYTFSLYKSRMQ